MPQPRGRRIQNRAAANAAREAAARRATAGRRRAAAKKQAAVRVATARAIAAAQQRPPNTKVIAKGRKSIAAGKAGNISHGPTGSQQSGGRFGSPSIDQRGLVRGPLIRGPLFVVGGEPGRRPPTTPRPPRPPPVRPMAREAPPSLIERIEQKRTEYYRTDPNSPEMPRIQTELYRLNDIRHAFETGSPPFDRPENVRRLLERGPEEFLRGEEGERGRPGRGAPAPAAAERADIRALFGVARKAGRQEVIERIRTRQARAAAPVAPGPAPAAPFVATTPAAGPAAPAAPARPAAPAPTAALAPAAQVAARPTPSVVKRFGSAVGDILGSTLKALRGQPPFERRAETPRTVGQPSGRGVVRLTADALRGRGPFAVRESRKDFVPRFRRVKARLGQRGVTGWRARVGAVRVAARLGREKAEWRRFLGKRVTGLPATVAPARPGRIRKFLGTLLEKLLKPGDM